MAFRVWVGVGAACLALSGCGSMTVPAAVRMDDGSQLVGTTTASMSAGTFEVSGNGLSCFGNYDQFSSAPTLSAPFRCSDGRTGMMTINRTPDLMAGVGTATLSDGHTARVAFGRLAGSVAPSSVAGSYPSYSSGRTYTGNCPTPDSLDAAGHRCGARSAASRPGGYDGYSSWSTPSYGGGSVYVRGHYRAGHYVRPYYRRR